jgi:lipopolysaccharide assembly outer membrane protein LptD (OstA)
LRIEDADVKYDRKMGVLRCTKRGSQQIKVEEVGKDFKLFADLLLYFEEQETADIEGNLKFANPDSTVTADKAHATFNESKIVFTEKVVLISRRKEETPAPGKSPDETPAMGKSNGEPGKGGTADAGKGDTAETGKGKAPAPRSKKTTLTCDQLDFDYDTRIGVATGNLRIEQEGRSATAEKATFDDGQNILTLEGNVEMKEKKADSKEERTMKCEKIVINADEDNWGSEKTQAIIPIKQKKKTPEPAKGKAGKAESKAVPGKSEAAALPGQ